jgi:hypothetical protein
MGLGLEMNHGSRGLHPWLLTDGPLGLEPMQSERRSRKPRPSKTQGVPPAVRGRETRAQLGSEESGATDKVPEIYQVVIECRHEREQQAVFERMRAEGYRCRVLTL